MNAGVMKPVCQRPLMALHTYSWICSAIIMPDDVAEEKVKALLALGAQVERVRPASIVDKKQVCASHDLHTVTLLIMSLDSS